MSQADEPSLLAELLSLGDPLHPAARLPDRFLRLLPDPMQEAGWERFRHQDLRDLSRSELRRELWSVRVALASCPGAAAPAWLEDRAQRLESSAERQSPRRVASAR